PSRRRGPPLCPTRAAPILPSRRKPKRSRLRRRLLRRREGKRDALIGCEAVARSAACVGAGALRRDTGGSAAAIAGTALSAASPLRYGDSRDIRSCFTAAPHCCAGAGAAARA